MTGPSGDRDPLERLAEEFTERYRRGERPSLAEYLGRYPEHAADIRDLFPALLLLEEVRVGPSPATPAGRGGSRPAVAGPPAFPKLGEYRIVREIGRGGMGVVYEAEQVSLGRRVALKVLPSGSLGDARQVERFRREARAAARLHHTNLVPLFGVGEEDGTLYYVMQHIDGRPLDEVLAELRRLRDEAGPFPARPAASSSAAGHLSSADVARSLWTGQFRGAGDPPISDSSHAEAGSRDSGSPAGPAPAPAGPGGATDPLLAYARRVAHLGIQVADALEYAAGQGIVHRDVKPANLLLDLTGTVWLTDFGLAKASGSPDLTRTGDLLGTLRYMAPERFRGRSDARGDVYALGLTLYELLALRPAFDASDEAELLRHLTVDEPTRLEAVDRRLPRDLATIIHKAMAKDPADRYQAAGALAEDLRRFLDDRPILARRSGAAEQAWRWCRRNPSAAALLATAVVLLILATAGGLRLQQQRVARRLAEARRDARERQVVEAALEQADGLRRQGLWAEGASVLAHAEIRLEDSGGGPLWSRLARARADLDLVAALERNRLGRVGLFGRKSSYRAVALGYEAAFARAGIAPAAPAGEHACGCRVRDSLLREPLVAALDDWALVTSDPSLRARLLRVARAVDPDPAWRDRVRDPAVWGDRHALERLEREVLDGPATSAPPQLLTTLGVLLQEAGGDPVPLLRAAQRRRPADFWLNFELGMVLRSRRPAEATGFCRAALALRPESGVVYNLLGLDRWADGRRDEAAAAFARAIELDPNLAAAHTNLGLILAEEGRLDEAIASHRKAIELDPVGPLGHNNLGEALAAAGLSDEATAAYRQAITLDPNLAAAHNNLGNLALDAGRIAEAIAAYRRAIALDPRGSAAHHNLGNAFSALGQRRRAIDCYREAIALDPDGPLAHHALGEALLQSGRFREAKSEAARWLEHLAEASPSRRREAREHLRRCGRLLEVDASWPSPMPAGALPPDPLERRDLAWLCQFSRGDHAAAARLYASAFESRPDLAEDLKAQDRYNAACSAAVAAAYGSDGVRLPRDERAAWRRRAREWLRDDLSAWARAIAYDPDASRRARSALRHWRADADLIAIRDPGPLAGLPAEERDACRRLWADVDTLLRRLSSSGPSPTRSGPIPWGRLAED